MLQPSHTLTPSAPTKVADEHILRTGSDGNSVLTLPCVSSQVEDVDAEGEQTVERRSRLMLKHLQLGRGENLFLELGVIKCLRGKDHSFSLSYSYKKKIRLQL